MLELDPEICGHCGGCVAVCPYGALELFVSGLLIKQELCTLCQNCVVFCPVGALQITNNREEIADKRLQIQMPGRGKTLRQENLNQR